MEIEFKDTVEDANAVLDEVVTAENELKTMLVNYVGEKLQPKNDEVNVEMIIQVMSEEFPEFLMPVAEENFIRGYRQALADVDAGGVQG